MQPIEGKKAAFSFPARVKVQSICIYREYQEESHIARNNSSIGLDYY